MRRLNQSDLAHRARGPTLVEINRYTPYNPHPSMTAKYTDPNQMPENEEVSATLLQDGRVLAEGTVELAKGRLTFLPTDPKQPRPSLLTPITLRLLGCDGEALLRPATDWHDHPECNHWDFQIAV